MEIKNLIRLAVFFLFLISVCNCGYKVVSVSEEEKKFQNRIDKMQDEATLRSIAFFEMQSQKTVKGENQVCQQEQESAKQFLADLRTVNDALPEDRKILDANGRLKDLSTLSPNQKQSMADIVFSDVGTAKQSAEVEDAVRRLSQKMSATRQAFDLSKPMYQPR